ncbi:MAG: hypothetical protein JOZ69_25845 [Myxococcales bacterium]|nr:hypothetical protein [Myxococcales bacterium]
MTPISGLRDRISSWLREDGPTKGSMAADEPDVGDECAPGELDEAPSLHLATFPAALAEPEEAVPVVVRGPLTSSPAEASLTRTSPGIRATVRALEHAWPELTEVGARTLAAQSLLETDGGSACWNWNIGNLKARADEPHVYLHGTWEVVASSAAVQLVSESNGLARIATEAEARAKGWSCPPGSQVVVFEPPHEATRFAAYRTLPEAVSAWVRYLREHVAARVPGFVTAVEAGDAAAVVHKLKLAGYDTAPEPEHAAGLRSRRLAVDSALGWSP